MSAVRVVRVGTSHPRVVKVFAGPPGTTMTWRGAWDSGATYAVLDVARYDGSSYVCVAPVGPAASTPDTDGAHWGLMAQAGRDGIDGTGTMNGPAAATDGHMAVFDGTTGGLVKDGGAVPTLASLGGATAAQGSKADTAVQPSSGVVVVNHGSTASTARPAGVAVVYWIGTVAPTNAVAGDLGYGWTA